MSTLYIYDFATKKAKVAPTDFLSIGARAACVVQTCKETVGAFMLKGESWAFYPAGDIASYSAGGAKTSQSTRLENERPVLIAIDDALILAYATSGDTPKALSGINPDSWYIYDVGSESWKGPNSVAQLGKLQDKYSQDSYLTVDGCHDPLAFCRFGDFLAFAKHNGLLQPELEPKPKAEPSAAEMRETYFGAKSSLAEPEEEEEVPEIDELNGKFVCPVCWLHFDLGDVMSIASHPDLMGDKILGRGAMKRFWATRFNSIGQALDAKGMPCRDIACPHCRRKLPPHYLNLRGHIFSVIGAPSSGKSYFLTALVHEMENSIAAKTSIIWQDADPSGNSMLNDAVNRLFSSDSPEEAYLSKTDLEGALYEELYRHGRMVKLPRPFVFNVSSSNSRTAPISAVFYDNAGEHFEPGRDSEDSPGAQHVAVASGLFFLYDPTTCRSLRETIRKDDPQLQGKLARMDQQIVILRETIVRISSILNLPPGDKVDTPMAVMIGKSDLWEDTLEGGELLPVLGPDGKVQHDNVDKNSARLRKFLMQFAPSICSYAEQLSSRVRYFAVSALGGSPVTFTDPMSGDTKIGPDPARVSPRHIEEPVLWVLSLLEPTIVPSAD